MKQNPSREYVTQLVKIYSAFYGSRKFMIVLTRASSSRPCLNIS